MWKVDPFLFIKKSADKDKTSENLFFLKLALKIAFEAS